MIGSPMGLPEATMPADYMLPTDDSAWQARVYGPDVDRSRETTVYGIVRLTDGGDLGEAARSGSVLQDLHYLTLYSARRVLAEWQKRIPGARFGIVKITATLLDEPGVPAAEPTVPATTTT